MSKTWLSSSWKEIIFFVWYKNGIIMCKTTGLFYANEHMSCSEYAKSHEERIFERFSFQRGDVIPETLITHSIIVFVWKGAIIAQCGPFFDNRIHAGTMLFLPNNCICSAKVLSDTVLLRCFFDKDTQMCTRFMLESLPKVVNFTSIHRAFNPLPIRERVRQFLVNLYACLNDGLGCYHFHTMKRQELALLFRGYYSREELAAFFYPILSEDMSFKEFVLSHFRKVENVEKLAELANLSPTTFNRRFKKTFGISFAQWLEKRKAEDILRDIRMTDKTFSEIADAHGFSSAAYFTTFCKRHFGKSPSEIRSLRSEKNG